MSLTYHKSESLLEDIVACCRDSVTPQEFWSTYIRVTTRMGPATWGVVVVHDGEDDTRLKRLALSPAESRQQIETDLSTCWQTAFESCQEQGQYHATSAFSGSSDSLVAVQLVTAQSEIVCLAMFRVPKRVHPDHFLNRLVLTCHLPEMYQLLHRGRDGELELERLAGALDINLLLSEQTRFVAAAMTLCNELSGRLQCSRVSLGWLDGSYIRLQAISHTEKFERKMEAVQALERVMEECLDQDCELIVPSSSNDCIVREHEIYSQHCGVGVCSVPLRIDDRVVAVVTCERLAPPFSNEDVRQVRLICDQGARHLTALRQHDRWIGARAASATRDGLGCLIGHENTWVKVISLSVAVALAVLCFGRLEFRVEAPFALHSEQSALLAAPYDGFIASVHREVGDQVEPGDALVELDTRDLLLELAAAEAERHRYQREAEKARGDGALAEMRIAEAMAQQAKSRVQLVQYRLDEASIKAPFHGVVAEGDLKERLGSPVRRGDVILKVAELTSLYVELSAEELDAHHLTMGATGEIAFAGQPRLKFPIEVVRIEPVAHASESGNTITVRCEMTGEHEDWWRPGMSGVAKVNCGKRNLLWIISRKTLNAARMLLWW